MRVARASKPQPLRGADNSLCYACSSSVPAGGAGDTHTQKKPKCDCRFPVSRFLALLFLCCSILSHFFSVSRLFFPSVWLKGLLHPRGQAALLRLMLRCTELHQLCVLTRLWFACSALALMLCVCVNVMLLMPARSSSPTVRLSAGCMSCSGASLWMHRLQSCWT